MKKNRKRKVGGLNQVVEREFSEDTLAQRDGEINAQKRVRVEVSVAEEIKVISK